MSYFRNQLENWLKTIDVETESVLDVGGSAQSVKDRVKSWKVEKYKILDNGQESGEKPDYFQDLNKPFVFEEKVDMVFCLEVFEYIWNPVEALGNLNDCLEPGGIVYISFPTIYPLHAPQGTDYLRYTKYGIIKLLGETGFTDIEITPRVATAVGQLSSFYSQEGMHPLKGTPDIYDIGYMVKAIKRTD